MPLFRIFYFRQGQICAVTMAAANDDECSQKATTFCKGWADDSRPAAAVRFDHKEGRAKDHGMRLLAEGKIEIPQFLLREADHGNNRRR